jgi:hypothetical protein
VCEFLCGLLKIYTYAYIYVNDLREFFVFVTWVLLNFFS